MNNTENTTETSPIETETQVEGSRRISLLEFFMGVVITVIVIFAVYKMTDPAMLPIKQVRIEGEFRQLSPSTLQTLVENKVRGGFFNIDVTAVRQAVLAEPWVKDVSVHRIWPDSLRVVVQEQVAAVRWKDTGLLNKEGDFFAADQGALQIELPVLDGPAGSEKLLMDKYQQANTLFKKTGMQLTRLALNERRAWTLILDNELRIIIGRSDFDQRVARFVEFVSKGLKLKMAQAKQVDMRYTNGFAVQWYMSTQDDDEDNDADNSDLGQGA